VLGIVVAVVLFFLLWNLYHPQFVRQVDAIPRSVHAMLRSHHAYYTSIAAISPHMQHAIVAIEDRRFYQHHGIDLRGIARALVGDITTRSFSQGGATITVQLVEGTVPLPSNAAVRVLDTLALAWIAEERFRKRRILELYLNAIYYGRGAYGIADAARTYFHESPRSLDVAQAAFLAALPQAPSLYGSNPYSSVMQSRWRTVIHNMFAQGYITYAQELTALHTHLRVPPG
jgi:penicillin-binding protein 1A